MATVSFIQVVESLQKQVEMGGPLWLMINAVCWIAAVLFGISAMMQLKELAENQRHSYRAPITSFIAAAVMMTAPEMIKSFMATAYGNDWGVSPLAYVKDSATTNKSFFAVLTLVTFIGYIFFIRGIWILKESGEPQRHPQSTVGKAIAVCMAGMAAIYIDFTLKVLGNTFGFDLSTYIRT